MIDFDVTLALPKSSHRRRIVAVDYTLAQQKEDVNQNYMDTRTDNPILQVLLTTRQLPRGKPLCVRKLNSYHSLILEFCTQIVVGYRTALRRESTGFHPCSLQILQLISFVILFRALKHIFMQSGNCSAAAMSHLKR